MGAGIYLINRVAKTLPKIVLWFSYTAGKASVFGVLLVCFFPNSD